MRITTKDIAKLAGVSRGTVDRVLNNRGDVSSEVKELVLKIAKESGYKKNILASNLSRNQKIKISVVIPNPEMDLFWKSPFEGIEHSRSYISNFGIELSFHLFDLSDPNSFAKACDESIKGKPNAILIAPVFQKESLLQIQLAAHNNIPVVCINSEINHSDILCYVGQDSYQCGVLAGKLFDLRKANKQKIVVITLGHNSKNAIHINKKIEGLHYYNSLNNCGFEIIEKNIEKFNEEKSLNRLGKELNEMSLDIHGIFFTNSRAYKFLEVNSNFRKVIKDGVVIGFDLLDKNIDFLLDGNIDFLLNQNPKRQGYISIMNLLNHFIHNKAIPSKIYLPIDIVVKENYLQYINEEEQFYELTV